MLVFLDQEERGSTLEKLKLGDTVFGQVARLPRRHTVSPERTDGDYSICFTVAVKSWKPPR